MRDRYQGKHDEHKQEQTVDRADEETFVCQNGDPNIIYFPGDEMYQEWIKTHKPAIMKTVSGPSSTMMRLEARPKRHADIAEELLPLALREPFG